MTLWDFVSGDVSRYVSGVKQASLHEFLRGHFWIQACWYFLETFEKSDGKKRKSSTEDSEIGRYTPICL